MAETKEFNIYRALMKSRVELQNRDIQKSGHNDYSHYDYFELSDFLPAINEICFDNNLVCLYEITDSKAMLHVTNLDDKEDKITFSIPVAELSMKGANAIQNVGGLTTYTRRYLYMIAFEIAENEEFDPNTKSEESKQHEINRQTISDKDVNVLLAVVEKKGVAVESILDRYKVNTFNEMVFEQFNSAMNILGKMPDKTE